MPSPGLYVPAIWPGVLAQRPKHAARSKLWPKARIRLMFAMVVSHRIKALLRHWGIVSGQTIAVGVAVPLETGVATVVVVTEGLQVPYPAMHPVPQ
jgi:hypothetical protein